MKKLSTLFLVAAFTLMMANFAFAENAVSGTAVAKGGQAIAACAKAMGLGVSQCAQLSVCQGMN